jgi:thymidylate synthase (FAD)
MIKVTHINHMGDDLTVVNAARVSFGKQVESLGYTGAEGGAMRPILHDRDIKLINYLAKHKHMSPFGHCFVSFHVKAPIFVARQLVKHKFLRWNEISRRYVDDTPSWYWPEDDMWRGKSEDKKQGSSGTIDLKEDQPLLDDVVETTEWCRVLYRKLLDKGIAPEQARMVLPQSTMTEWYWSGSLDTFADMCLLRTKDDTQVETTVVALQVCEIMRDLFPNSWYALLTTPYKNEIRPMTEDEKQRGKEKSIANGRR